MTVERTNACINNPIILRETFQYAETYDFFDPYAISKVEILDSNQTTVLETITGANIVKSTTGQYYVIASAISTPKTIYDKWYFTPSSGASEMTEINTCVIFATINTIPSSVPTSDRTWANVSDIRRITGVDDTEFDDGTIEEFITLAQKEVNSKIVTKVIRERVLWIDNFRRNGIDGVTTTYYMRNWKGNYLADFNYDNVIDLNDIKVVQYDRNTQLETQLTPISIDILNCSFTLGTAPSNVDLFVDYAYSPLNPIVPDDFVTQCVSYLAGSYLFIGNDGFKIKFGNVTIEPGQSGGKGKQLYDKYQNLLSQLFVNSGTSTQWAEMSIKI